MPGYPDVNTRISIGFGTCTGMGCLAGDDDSGPNGTSDVTFFAEEGTTYHIKFDCHQSACSFAFQLSEFDPLAAPVDVIGFQGTMVRSAQPIRGIVDMNGDGLDDVVTPAMNALNIAFQQPGGGFTNTSFPHPMIVEPASSSMAAGDIDNNGHTDLFYAGAQNSVHVLLATADDSAYAAQPVSLGGTFFRNNLVDINSDGHLDGFLTNEPGANLLLMNNGSGTLGCDDQYLGAICGHKGSLWTDVDNDGNMDLFLTRAGCGNADQLLRNDGDLSFTDIAAGVTLGDNHRGQSSAWGDFDNDGDMDAFIGASGSPTPSFQRKLMRNNGDGTFTNVVIGSGLDLFAGQGAEWITHDLNNDGWLDIIGGGNVHYGIGDLRFLHGGVLFPSGVGDLNSDGLLDLHDQQVVWFNSGNGNNWLRVRTVGTVSNRSGIGARVEVNGPLGMQIRDIRSGEGLTFMSSLMAHFGLAQNPEVYTVTVRWPSGIVDVVYDPLVNGVLTVVEGDMSTGMNNRRPAQPMLYPNPAMDRLFLRDAEHWNGGEWCILDATGREVAGSTLQMHGIDISGLRPGMYRLRLTGKSGVSVRAFVKE